MRFAEAPGRSRIKIKTPSSLALNGMGGSNFVSAVRLQHGEQHVVAPFAVDAQILPRVAFFLKSGFEQYGGRGFVIGQTGGTIPDAAPQSRAYDGFATVLFAPIARPGWISPAKG